MIQIKGRNVSSVYENDRTTHTVLAGYLRERGLKRIFLAGLAFGFCVRYSAEDARREGFHVAVLDDCCRSMHIAGSAEAARDSLRVLAIPTYLAEGVHGIPGQGLR